MGKIMMSLVMCFVAILASTQLFFGQVFAADKVVVIPLNSSKAATAPTCITRESAAESLDTWYKQIDVSCLEGETLMTGGFKHWNYNTSKDCRVIESRPVGNEWHVTWGMPTETECETSSAKTYAVCCTW